VIDCQFETVFTSTYIPVHCEVIFVNLEYLWWVLGITYMKIANHDTNTSQF